MIRSSKLQTAEFCGLAGSYEERTSSVYALGGRAFGAELRRYYRPSDQEATADAQRALAQLSEGERELVLKQVLDLGEQWQPPPSARFEDQMALDINGMPVAYDDPRAITRGSTDCWWLEPNTDASPAARPEVAEEVDNPDGIDVGRFRLLAQKQPEPEFTGTYTLYVVDFKQGPRAEFNVPPPSDNLQLASYGLGLLEKAGQVVTDVRLGLYLVAANRFVWWRTNATGLFAMWDRVRAAALRDPDVAVTGGHCVECYSRKKCRAYLVPALGGDATAGALAPMFQGESGEITDEAIVQLLLAAKAMEEIADQAKDFAKNHVKLRGEPVVSGTKQWGPRATKGRESTSISLLKATGLYETAVAQGAVKQGEPYETFTWTNR